MSASLADLSPDILVEIMLYLDLQDVAHLSYTCKYINELCQEPSVWHSLYERTFGLQPNPFTVKKWPEMYRWRSQASVYVWGECSRGRLGVDPRDISNSVERSPIRWGALCKPFQLPQFRGSGISDIVMGGYNLWILSAETGKCYMMSRANSIETMDSPGPVSSEDAPDWTYEQAFAPRGPLSRLVRWSGQRDMPVTVAPDRDSIVQESPVNTPVSQGNYREMLLAEHGKDAKLVSISAGRSHLLALDNQNRLWTWDSRGQVQSGATEIILQGVNIPSNDSIARIGAGWGISVVYIPSIGLIVWHSRTPQTAEHTAEAKCAIIRGTKNNVVDFVALNRAIVFIDADRKLFIVRVDSYADSLLVEPEELTNFTRYLEEKNKSHNGGFTRISGSFRTFAAISAHDDVLVGNLEDSTLQPEVIPELQHAGCISVAVGDWHSLALMKGGVIYSWGIEMNHCGCLGLGLVQSSGPERSQAHVKKPTRVSFDSTKKRVLAIAAGGWQSCALVTDDADVGAVEEGESG